MIVFTVPEDDKAGLAFMTDLYRRYSRLMYTTARRCVSSGQECEDIVQDAVESLCKKLHTLMDLPAPALSVYIVHTVKNQAKNFIRHQAVVQNTLWSGMAAVWTAVRRRFRLWRRWWSCGKTPPACTPCGPTCRSRTGSSSTGSMCWARAMRSWRRFFNAGRTTSVCG